MEMKIQNEINKHIKGRNKLIPSNLFYNKQGNNRQIDSKIDKKIWKEIKACKNRKEGMQKVRKNIFQSQLDPLIHKHIHLKL